MPLVVLTPLHPTEPLTAWRRTGQSCLESSGTPIEGQLAGTRVSGFVLTRQEATGKWGTGPYSLVRT
jgi:hypothetical protein